MYGRIYLVALGNVKGRLGMRHEVIAVNVKVAVSLVLPND